MFITHILALALMNSAVHAARSHAPPRVCVPDENKILFQQNAHSGFSAIWRLGGAMHNTTANFWTWRTGAERGFHNKKIYVSGPVIFDRQAGVRNSSGVYYIMINGREIDLDISIDLPPAEYNVELRKRSSGHKVKKTFKLVVNDSPPPAEPRSYILRVLLLLAVCCVGCSVGKSVSSMSCCTVLLCGSLAGAGAGLYVYNERAEVTSTPETIGAKTPQPKNNQTLPQPRVEVPSVQPVQVEVPSVQEKPQAPDMTASPRTENNNADNNTGLYVVLAISGVVALIVGMLGIYSCTRSKPNGSGAHDVEEGC
jgi:hypothetical protein